MVVCIHCADPFNVSPEGRSNPDFHLWGSIYGAMLRPCVPIFVMLTGILVLPVTTTWREFYTKRLLRVAIPFGCWSVIYNIVPWITGLIGLPSTVLRDIFAYAPIDASQSLGDALRNILLTPLCFNVYTTHLWYIYMLMGLYLFMPFFSSWLTQADKRQKRFFLTLWFVSLFIPYAYYYLSPDIWGRCTWNEFGMLYYFSGFNGYLLLGHYLFYEVRTGSWLKTISISLPLILLGFAVTYVGFTDLSSQPQCSELQLELYFQYCSPQVAAMTTGLFLLIRKICEKQNTDHRIMTSVTRCGLGIYMSHYLIIGVCYALTQRWPIPTALRIPATALIALAITWSLVAALHRMTPTLAKRLLG